MASLVPVITGITLATNNTFVTRLLELGGRCQTNHHNKIKWTSLAASYKTFGEGIIHYKSAIDFALSSDESLSSLDKEELKRLSTHLDNIVNDMKSILPKLDARLQQVSSSEGLPSTNPTQHDQNLSESQTQPDQGSNFAGSTSTNPNPRNHHLSRKNRSESLWGKSKKRMTKLMAFKSAYNYEKEIKYLDECLEKLDTKLKEGKKLIEDKFGIFKVYFKNYNRGDNIYLDYENGDHDDASHEAQLKHTLLNPPNTSNSTKKPSVPRTICVEGQGGMGKTTILKDICTDEDVRRRFCDGIHFMTLGEGADDGQVLSEISRCLKNAGFGTLGAKVKDEENVEEASLTVSNIFQDKRLLIVVDDWHPGHIIYFKHMQSLLCASKNGVLLVSSRYKQISCRCNKVVFFKELKPTGTESKKILEAIIGEGNIDEKDDDETKQALKKVLVVCGGIKLCLAIAGSSIRLQGHSLGIKRYVEDLERSSEDVVTDAGGEEMRTFLNVLVTSLQYWNNELERHICKDMKGGNAGRIEARDLFKGLCVFEKQQGIPIQAISRLWNIDRSDSVYITRKLSSYGVVIVDANEQFVEIHDKVMDVSKYLAKKDEKNGKDGIREYHERILRRYVPLLGQASHEEEGGRLSRGRNESEQQDEETYWARFSCPREWELGDEEEYFVGNVCRHLEEGGRIEELWKLVTNVWWTLRRRKTGGWVGIESDFKRLKRFCKGERGRGNTEQLLSDHEEVGLEILINYIRDVWMGIKEDEHMIGFEMFGRVLKEDQKYKVVERYLKNIEEEGPRPWLRPTTAGLGKTDSRQLCEIPSKNGILDGSCVSDDSRFVVCLGKEGLEVIDIETEKRWWIDGEWSGGIMYTSICSKTLTVACGWECGKMTVWDLEKGEQVGESRIGHVREVWCVATSNDGNRIVYGGEHKNALVWDVEKGERIGKALPGHRGMVRCVGISGDGNRAVTAGSDRIIRLWDLEKGEQVGKALTGHEGGVKCIGMSEDGNRVVSGGGDGSVRVWDLEKGEQVGKALTGHEGWVTCIGMNEDGNRVVSGGVDGSVRVWDFEKGEQVGKALTGHTGWVKCIGMSEDGNRVVSGGVDGSVRVWDVNKADQIDAGLVRHDGWVTCVEVSADGRRIVSGGQDGSLRIWDGDTAVQKGQGIFGHQKAVNCVGMSADGSRIVSGGDDGSVRVWDVEKGEQVGLALTGHDGEVSYYGTSDDGNRGDSDGLDESVQVRNAAENEQVDESLIVQVGGVWCVGCSSDGKRVVSGGVDGSVRVWDVEKSEQIGDALIAHKGWVECVGISNDGNRVVSGGEDERVRVWDVVKSEPVGEPLIGHQGEIWYVRMSDDGNRVVSSGGDGTIRVWDAHRSLQLGENFQFFEPGRNSSEISLEDETLQKRYNDWLKNIRTCISEQEGINESMICMKSFHEENAPVLVGSNLFIRADPVCCDCSDCDGENERDECSVENEALAMWVKEDKYIHVSSARVVKVGRVDDDCDCYVKDDKTIVIGLKNGRIMICRLQL